jgi:hypothetical protein
MNLEEESLEERRNQNETGVSTDLHRNPRNLQGFLSVTGATGIAMCRFQVLQGRVMVVMVTMVMVVVVMVVDLRDAFPRGERACVCGIRAVLIFE